MFLPFTKKDFDPIDLYKKLSSKYTYFDVVDIFHTIFILDKIGTTELNKKIKKYTGLDKKIDIKSFLNDNEIIFNQTNSNIDHFLKLVTLINSDNLTNSFDFKKFLYLLWNNSSKFSSISIPKIKDIVQSHLFTPSSVHPFAVICNEKYVFNGIHSYVKIDSNSDIIITVSSISELKDKIITQAMYAINTPPVKFVFIKTEAGNTTNET